jgi:CxxC motif-containing protein (DUF1111 family)
MRIIVVALGMSAVVAATGALASGELDSVLGKALFERDWVPAGSSTDAANGLGPLFAARSCTACHAGPALGARFTDAPDGRIAGRGFVMRFGDRDGNPDPLYGHLLQGQAVPGMTPEGRIVLLASADPDRSYDVEMELMRGPRSNGSTRAPSWRWPTRTIATAMGFPAGRG